MKTLFLPTFTSLATFPSTDGLMRQCHEGRRSEPRETIGSDTWCAAGLEPGRRMLWWDQKGEYSWEWLLEPSAAGTRLVSRLRVTRHPWTRRMLYEVVAANGDIVMFRRMLRGIKKRAERLAADPAPVDRSPSS